MKTPRQVWIERKRKERQELVNLYYNKGYSMIEIAKLKKKHPRTVWYRINKEVKEQNKNA